MDLEVKMSSLVLVVRNSAQLTEGHLHLFWVMIRLLRSEDQKVDS